MTCYESPNLFIFFMAELLQEHAVQSRSSTETPERSGQPSTEIGMYVPLARPKSGMCHEA